MLLAQPFNQRERALVLAGTGVIQFYEEGKPLKAHRDHPDWDLPLSPYFVNMRLRSEGGPLEPWQAEMFGQDMALAFYKQMAKLGRENEALQIVGIPNAAISLAKGFADAWPVQDKITLLRMFKEGEGKGVIVPKIDGKIDPNRPITLVDDVITLGGSKIDTLKVVRSMGYTVDKIIVGVDREQGGREEMKKEGVELYSVTNFSQILEACRKLGMIDLEMYKRCVQYPELLESAIAEKQGE